MPPTSSNASSPSTPTKKRNATSSPQTTPSAAKRFKHEKPASVVPDHADGDVTISLGPDKKLKLHSKKLRKKCHYFRQFDQLPQEFILESSDSIDGVVPADSAPVDSPTICENTDTTDVHPATAAASTATNIIMERSRAANETIFRLLYRQPLLDDSMECVFDATELVRRYGCVKEVKDGLALAILTENLQTNLFQNEPWAVLTAAYNLHNNALFSEALMHVVGRGGDTTRVPDGAKNEVVDCTEHLKTVIRWHWERASRRCNQSDGTVSGALAMALMNSYLKGINYSTNEPFDPNVYKGLRELYLTEKDDLASQLLSDELLDAVGYINRGLAGALEFIDTMEQWHGDEDEDEDEFGTARARVNRAINQDLSERTIRSKLIGLICNVRLAISRLFEDDRNAGYFTYRRRSKPSFFSGSG